MPRATRNRGLPWWVLTGAFRSKRVLVQPMTQQELDERAEALRGVVDRILFVTG